MKNDAERDSQVMTLVATALQQPVDQRKSFLQRACHGDAQLYQEAIDTVEWEERMGNFLLEPLVILKDFEHPFHPGEVISERFEIVREVGEGGMGVVYEAYDRKRNQRIAIKSAKTGFRRLLTPELESALKVRHANICLVNEIHTASTAQGEIDFLTMEFLDGEALSAALSSGTKFGQKEAMEIARQLCAGLAEAHGSGIVHRDLKSANVILCRLADGKLRAVITDFGLAGATVIGPGDLAGTLGYMAPELWQGVQASKASDIYALGVILYELVTGLQPFEEGQEADHNVPSGPRPPSMCTEGLDRRWDAAILPCLDPSPSARPQSAAEVFAQLQKKPVRKAPLIALAVLIIASLTPAVRQPLLEYLKPASVRLAILPPISPEDTTAISSKVLQNVSERVRRLRRAGAPIAVVSSAEVLRKNVHTVEQAKTVLHATHVLQVTLSRDGNGIEAKASVIELATQAHLREFSGRYTPEIADEIPRALAGVVSSALRLRSDAVSEEISAAAKAPYNRALYLLRRNQYSSDQALSLFTDAALLDPHSPLPLAGLARAQIQKFYVTKQQHYFDDAQQSLHQAEALDPDTASVHLAAGLLNQTIGQDARALEDYQRVEDLEPHNIDALLNSALIYEAQNMPDKAFENCQQAIRFEPASSRPYQQLGSLYYHRGKYLLAAEQFQRAIDRDHGLVDSYASLGGAMIELGRQAEAEQALLTSLTIRETARALNGLGTIRDYQGRDAEAAGYYQRAVAIEPTRTIYWANLGDSERRLGRSVEARAAFRRVKDLALTELQQNPHRGYSRAFVAYSKLRLGDNGAAEEEISQALHSSPGNGEVIHFALLIYEALGQRDRTIDLLSGSPPEVVQEVKGERDLARLREDPRFVQLAAKTREGSH